MPSDNGNDIELACKAFQRTVVALIQKIRRRKQLRGEHDEEADTALERDCQRLVRHSNHVLRTLAAKRTSLRHAITAFGESSVDYVRRFTALEGGEGDEQRRVILRTWFRNYLRLRDGFVLLESGERRHLRDGDDAGGVDVSQRMFPSRLSGSYRGDGVTRKFSSEKGYTGAGYDECYDEDVGIKKRLLDALAKMDGRSYDVWIEKLFDNDLSGARLWEQEMDNHISESKTLRADLKSIQQKFVTDINRHLTIARHHQKSKTGGPPDKLKLVTDDKSERITLGLVDIARQGNALNIPDAGGSLPFGMTVQGWKKKFDLIPSKQYVEKVAIQKKRKFIIEDSSDEDQDGANIKAACVKRHSQVSAKDVGKDGLAVRVREATDVNNAKGKDQGGKTTSIDEMKRQLGVDNAQLEQGRERVEEEQLRSKIEADDEDMREGFFGDVKNSTLSTHAPLLKACLSSRAELCKNDLYRNDIKLLMESQEYWADLDNSLMNWKGHFQALLLMHNNISNGTLDGSSDHDYSLRENFREANMVLGIDSIKIYEFFSSQLQKNQQTVRSNSNLVVSPLSSLEDSLSKVCHSYLRLAEETFKSALNLILEQEDCEASSASINDVASLWEKGQHFLLRGRAYHNIGQTLYELAQYYESSPKQQAGKHKPKDFLMKAREEFNNALLRAKSLRHNTVLIHGHDNAKDMSTQNNFSWAAEATLHSLEAIKLECNASVFHISCSWKLDRMEEAQERFNGFFNSIETSDVFKLAGTDGVSYIAAAETLDDMYWLAMRVAELWTQFLESMTSKKGWNAKVGEEFYQIRCKAMKRAASINDQLLKFADQHSLDAREHITTRAAMEKDESDICKWWEATKAGAQRKLSDVVQSARAADSTIDIPRSEVAGDVCTASGATQLPKRIFIADSRPLQNTTLPRRTRQSKNNNTGNETVSDRFYSEFCSDKTSITVSHSYLPMETRQDKVTQYRKWGNEVLKEHQRKRCCPPLPKKISDDLLRALDRRLGDILPTK